MIGHTLVGRGAEKVIVLHGWFGDHTVFAPMLPSLDQERFTYAFVDYRGYGKSRSLTGEYSLREIAADAIALADSLGWRRFHAIGHSMGGAVVQRLLVDAAGRVASAVCVTPVPASGVPMAGEQLALFSAAAASDANRAIIVDFSTGQRLTPRWVQDLVRRSRETSEEQAFGAYFRAWSQTNFVAEVRGNATPMLVAIGAHDLALTAEVMKATFLDWYPNAELEIIANAGHYPMEETPVYLATLWEKFLQRHSAAR